ncbi:exonuclease 1 [Hetaerina americana]|uniref:exonuclease 1 n=1 Tax=Hetaerina americana TaxID=62018 RepID=UPI003A7F26C7
MGITGLIPFLEKASTPVNLRQYKGQTLAVDVYCWLHRGIFSCAEKIAKGEKCDAYVTYCLKYVNMLISHDIKPILVFDGRYLPAKAATEKKRRQSREQNRTKAAELLRQGRTAEARRCLRNSVDVGPEMAVAVARACRSVGADCIIAPFEADAELAYLNRSGIATAVVTEDSDLILFGCSRVIFKLDLMGCGLEVIQDRLHLAMGVSPERFSMDRFRQMCVLSGCDYLASLPGIGLAKAKKFVNSTSSPDISQALPKLPSATGLYNLEVTEEYIKEFAMADATFLYQLVYDPVKRAAVPLNDPSHISLHLELAEKIKGNPQPPEIEYQLALGNLNPFTLKPIDDFNPSGPKGPCGGGIGRNGPPKRKWKSIWDKNFLPYGDTKNFHSQNALMKVERDSTFGKEAVMGVGFFNSQVIEDGPVRRSPRKRKHKVDVEEENMVKEATCSPEDLDIIYGSPSPKRQKSTSHLMENAKSCFNSFNESSKMVVAEIIGPQELKRKLFTKPQGLSPVKSKLSANLSNGALDFEGGSQEGMSNSSQESVPHDSESDLKATESEVKENCIKSESVDPVSTLSPRKNSPNVPRENGDDSDRYDESSHPKSPILGRRKNLNPFAKPLGSSSDSSHSKGSFLKSPGLFSKLNVNEGTSGMKTVVKSRYLVSSPPKDIGLSMDVLAKNKSPILERLNDSDLLCNDKSDKEPSTCGELKVSDIVGGYLESEIQVSPPLKNSASVANASPRKPNNPFSLDSDSTNTPLIRREKPFREDDDIVAMNNLGGDKSEFSEPRKGLFNWSSLKDKFVFTSAIKDADESNAALHTNKQVSPKENQRIDSLGNTPRPVATRGRGRGQNCRRPGLGRSSTPKANPVTVKGNVSQQSLLMRFGFQKK